MLRSVYLLVMFILGLGFLSATEVTLELKDIEVKDGVIYITICDEKNFVPNDPKKNVTKDCYSGASMRVNGSKVYRVSFNIPEGEWAIYGYIDEDFSEKLETTTIGIPKEAVLFTKRLRGEPKFKDIKTLIQGDKQTVEVISQ